MGFDLERGKKKGLFRCVVYLEVWGFHDFPAGLRDGMGRLCKKRFVRLCGMMGFDRMVGWWFLPYSGLGRGRIGLDRHATKIVCHYRGINIIQ